MFLKAISRLVKKKPIIRQSLRITDKIVTIVAFIGGVSKEHSLPSRHLMILHQSNISNRLFLLLNSDLYLSNLVLANSICPTTLFLAVPNLVQCSSTTFSISKVL